MKKITKYLLTILLIVIFAIIAYGIIFNKPLPKGTEGPLADELAQKMLTAINKPAYDSIKILSWSFPAGHHFNWNKHTHEVNVKWSDYEVDFITKTFEGKATKNGITLEGDDKKDAIHLAWKYFANDSFWLVAPFKVNDPGTIRKYVETEEGHGLLVTYTSGGVTPGDTYLWILDENYRPIKWKMWVSIIPIGGLETSWEGWVEHQGAWFALEHSFCDLFSMKLDGVHFD